MAIRVGRRQFMVDILRHSKRRQSQEDTDNPQGHSTTEHGDEEAEFHGQNDHGTRMGRGACPLAKPLNPAENKPDLIVLSRGMDFSLALS